MTSTKSDWATPLLQWHSRLLLQPQRGERARLRRARSLEKVVLAPAFHTLVSDLDRDWLEPNHKDFSKWAVIAAVAAGVNEHRLGRRLGQRCAGEGAGGPTVSEVRFRRLLESEDDDLNDRLALFRRLVTMLDKTVDLVDLARTLLYWNSDRKRQLAYDYFPNVKN
jgi:CRISPR type I-E-associated protein CasB/Cse2